MNVECEFAQHIIVTAVGHWAKGGNHHEQSKFQK